MMKKIGLIFASVCLLLLFYCPDTVHATSTTVCVADSMYIPNFAYPAITFSVSGNPMYYYAVGVYRWNGSAWILAYTTGDYGLGVSPMVGNYTHYVPPGYLPVDGSKYLAIVAVHNNYEWTPWAQGTFVLGAPGVCGTANGGVSCSTAGDQGGTLCASGSVVGMTAVNCGWYWQCSGGNNNLLSPVCKSFRSVPLGSCGTVPF